MESDHITPAGYLPRIVDGEMRSAPGDDARCGGGGS